MCVCVCARARGTSWALCSLCQKEAKSTRTERGKKKKEDRKSGGKRRVEEKKIEKKKEKKAGRRVEEADTSVPPVSGDKDGVARACDEL